MQYRLNPSSVIPCRQSPSELDGRHAFLVCPSKHAPVGPGDWNTVNHAIGIHNAVSCSTDSVVESLGVTDAVDAAAEVVLTPFFAGQVVLLEILLGVRDGDVDVAPRLTDGEDCRDVGLGGQEFER